MRGFLAKLFVAFSSICAAILLLVIIASFAFPTEIDWCKDGGIAGYRGFGFSIGAGGMLIGYSDSGLPLPIPWKLNSIDFPRHPNYPRLSAAPLRGIARLGFTFATDPNRGGPSWLIIIFPLWLPLVLFAIAPALAFRNMRRSRLRLRENHCLNCGYDLRATPDRCPECGTVGGQP